MSIESEDQLAGLRGVGRVVADTVRTMAEVLRAGITTAELDAVGEAYLRSRGAVSAPRSTYGFPGATCISVNDEVAHGIPGPRVIRDGDLVNIDVSASIDGIFADTGASFPVGAVSDRDHALCDAGRSALLAGVRSVGTGRRFSTLGRNVEAAVGRTGFRVIRDLSGHGVGDSLHEAPDNVRNYYESRDRRRMTEGLVFTIEPMVSVSAERVVEADDGWTLKTADGSRVVQYEHTVVTTRRGPIVVTSPAGC